MSIKLLTTIGLQEGHIICHFSFDGYPLRNNKIGTSGERACCMSSAAAFLFSCKSARRFCRLSKASGKNEAPSKKRRLYGYQVFPLPKVFVEKILKLQCTEFLKLFFGPHLRNIKPHAERTSKKTLLGFAQVVCPLPWYGC